MFELCLSNPGLFHTLDICTELYVYTHGIDVSFVAIGVRNLTVGGRPRIILSA